MPIVAAVIIAPLVLFMNIGFWFPSHGKGGTGGYPDGKRAAETHGPKSGFKLVIRAEPRYPDRKD